MFDAKASYKGKEPEPKSATAVGNNKMEVRLLEGLSSKEPGRAEY